MKHTLVVGTDFRKSSLRMREKLHIDDKLKPEIITDILKLEGIDECVIVTTCNRVEIYIVCNDHVEARDDLLSYLKTLHNINLDRLKDNLYFYHCEDAARHLLRVAAGLESMVIGESEILGQIKNAYRISKSVGGSGPFLNKLFQAAISLGKKVRHLTPINEGVTSIGSAAAKLAIDIAAPSKSTFGVIGCGTMGSTVAKNLIRAGAKKINLLNRTKKKGTNLASEIGGNFLPLDKISQLLQISDVVITATAAASHIISKKQIERAIKGRGLLTVIDIAVPRDVELFEDKLENFKLYTIDDLKSIVDKNITLRRSATEIIDDYIENKLGYFCKWYQVRNQYEETEDWDARVTPSPKTGRNRSEKAQQSRK